ncbi:hypothetical protein S40288_00644 [Stachybotrys chartarum IBT 40288]|nr:hypothetical protein S40288_00644 [Stachybotrys chartarum IBT 40288]
MAPEPPQQKRKRGRPSLNATAPDASQTTGNDDNDRDNDADARPRKRGRPTKEVAAEPETTQTEAQPRKRGRPSGSKIEVATAQTNGVDDVPQPRTRRRRKSPSPAGPGRIDEDQPEESLPAPKRKRGRPSLQSAADAQRDRPERHPEAQPPPPKQRRGRSSLQPEAEAEAASQPVQQKRRRGRPSLESSRGVEGQRETDSAPQPATQRRKRNRPSTLHPQPTDTHKGPSKKISKPRRTSGEQTEATSTSDKQQSRRRSSGAAATTAEPRGSKRRVSSPGTHADEESIVPPSPDKPYTHVAPRVRRIRQSVIHEKWSPLAASSLSTATDILQLAQQPILTRLSNTHQRRAHTSTALHLVAGRIARKMRKGLPFPPAAMPTLSTRGGGDADGGREVEMDFERVLDAQRALERQLDPALHAVQLLQREKDRMEKELERDYQALKALEVSARGQAREQRGLLKKAHPLAPDAMMARDKRQRQWEQDAAQHLSQQKNGGGDVGSIFADFGPDEAELEALALQLAGHMESIQTNMNQAEGIVPQILKSKADLQNVLLQHLDLAQYQEVLLGQ